MTTLEIRGGRALNGAVIAPPDKSISHRALILAALGKGDCTITPLSAGADNRSTLQALRTLGVEISVSEDESSCIVTGVGGPDGLTVPDSAVDCGNSGTTMRLLAGVGATLQDKLTLTGDASLCGRPMSRLSPLQEMGATLEGTERAGKIYPPITIGRRPDSELRGVTHRLRIASAQVKSACLLAGLWAEGDTTVYEPGRSRDHTERMLRALGVAVREGDDGGLTVSKVATPWQTNTIEVAPDMSSAAFILGAAFVTKSEGVVVETAVNPTRSGFLDALAAFGAEIVSEPLTDRGGEPMARLSLKLGDLRGATIAGELTLRAIDEIPLIAALAANIEGRTVITDAAELRVKESDRLATTAELLSAFGARCQERPDGLVIDGDPAALRAATARAGHDHRIGMTAAVLGLGLPGCTRVEGAEIIDVSYPGFAEVLRRLGAEVR